MYFFVCLGTSISLVQGQRHAAAVDEALFILSHRRWFHDSHAATSQQFHEKDVNFYGDQRDLYINEGSTGSEETPVRRYWYEANRNDKSPAFSAKCFQHSGRPGQERSRGVHSLRKHRCWDTRIPTGQESGVNASASTSYYPVSRFFLTFSYENCPVRRTG